MRRRLLESLGVAAVMAVLVMFLQLSAAGQAPAARRDSDCQRSRFQRPPGVSPISRGSGSTSSILRSNGPQSTPTREFFTERGAKPHRTTSDRATSAATSAPSVGSRQDVAGAYNAVFTSAKPTGRRTSLVVDPPNGRIPALTARDAGAEPSRSGIPPGAASEHRDLQEQDAGLHRLEVRPAVAAARRKCRRSTTRSG